MAEIVWTREDCRLTYIAADIEALVGWAAEEILAMVRPLESLVSPSTFEFLQKNYLVGPAASIMPRSFPLRLLHRDGHKVCCRVAVVCRYDGDGELAEAWGTLQHCQDQCNLNCLLEWWPVAEPSELAALNEIVALAAA